MKKFRKPWKFRGLLAVLLAFTFLFTCFGCSKTSNESSSTSSQKRISTSKDSFNGNSSSVQDNSSIEENSSSSSTSENSSSNENSISSENSSSNENVSSSGQGGSSSSQEPIQITYYERESTPNSYKYQNYSLDFLLVANSVIATEAPNVNAVKSFEVEGGAMVSLIGWIGFKQEISKFGYFFNNDIQNAVFLDSFMLRAESAVINAGGTYAKRFNIGADTTILPNGENKISFVAVLNDGVYVIIYSSIANVTGKSDWDGVIILDADVVKADKQYFNQNENVISTKNSYTSFTTSGGLQFTTSQGGLYDTSTKRFLLSKGAPFTINFNQNDFLESFNKFKISYYSSAYVMATLTYEVENSVVYDEVYLEKGTQLFSCLTQNFFAKTFASKISKITFEVIGENSASFSLHNVETEVCNNANVELEFIENERYKVGVKLSWGGGISYIEDKFDENANLNNLINNYDTGRLVQQSYYGTTDKSEYEAGEYGGSEWAYNPVQGGNVFGEASRIIDFVILNRSIYVKTQPRDWAKQNLTKSYMENVYTLYSNRIVVDNRFIDFSQYSNATARHQELPAFYTVGYLNTFVYYGGNSPWQNGALTYKNSLGFWGGNSDAYFNLNSLNTETWCAFVNEKEDFGIGLFTPNAEILLAGRYLYDTYPDAFSASNPACSYVSPLKTFKLESFKPTYYSFMITTGNVQQIRKTFRDNKDFATNSNLG